MKNNNEFIVRINQKWKNKTKGQKLFYIGLVSVAIIFLSLLIWSLAYVDQVRIQAYNTLLPLKQSDGTLLETDPIYGNWAKVFNEKFLDRGLKVFSWFLASKTEWNSLSASLYILCPISAFITAPILIYLISSFLVIAFPRKTKEERLALKKQKQLEKTKKKKSIIKKGDK